MGLTCVIFALVGLALGGLTWFMCAASAQREKQFKDLLKRLDEAERQ